jgi:hypothetical protein
MANSERNEFTSTLDTLSERVAELEKKNTKLEKFGRKWTVTAVILGVMLFAVIATGFAYSADRVEDVISVRQIEIVDDDGEVRGYFGYEDETVGLGIFDRRENVRALLFYDDANESCFMSFLDRGQEARAILGDPGEGGYLLAFADEYGALRLLAGYNGDDDVANFALADEDEDFIWTAVED